MLCKTIQIYCSVSIKAALHVSFPRNEKKKKRRVLHEVLVALG
jgi:hypothetical protein